MRVFLFSLVLIFSGVAVIYSTVCFVAFPLKYKNEIRKYSAAAGVDPVLAASIIRAESRFQKDAVSKKGAVGLMQILPSTAEYMAEMHGIEDYDLTTPRDNIRIGTLYLDYLLDKFKDVKTAVMAYNAGEGNVTRWLESIDDNKLKSSPFPETNAYAEKVLNAMTYYRYRV